MNFPFKAITKGCYVIHCNAKSSIPTPLHYHNAYELYYLFNGKRNYLMYNNIFPISSDWMTLTKPNTIHGTSGEPYERIVINFSEEFLLQHLQPDTVKKLLNCFSIHIIPSGFIKNNPRIKELFCLMLKVFHSQDQENKEDLLALYLGELLFSLNETIKSMPNQAENSNLPKQVQDIINFINDNISTISNLDQIANHFFISKDHLSHLFKKHTGFTVIEFLTEIKISRSTHLLQQTTKSVAEISELCGFDTPAYFCIVFKKKLGMTPLQYRNRLTSK